MGKDKNKNDIYLGRRDFIKTTAMAVAGSVLSFQSVHAADMDITSNFGTGARLRKKNKNLFCLTATNTNYDKIISLIKSNPDIDLNVTAVQVNYMDPGQVMNAVQGKNAGIILACLPVRTFSFRKLSQQMGSLDVPIVLYSPNADLIMIDANFAAELRTRGANVKLARTEVEVIEILKKASAPGILEGKKALVFGRPFDSTSVPAHNLTEEYVYEHTGVKLQYHPMDELKALLKDVSKESAEKEAERWKKEATKVDRVPARVLLDQCKMYVLLRTIIEKEELSAISMDCLGYSFTPNPILPLPCLAFARLRDDGFTAACEADVCGLLTSMAMEKISGRSSYFSNVASLNTDRSSTVLRHCVAPLKMLGPDAPQLAYKLDNYHGLGTALVPKVEFPMGAEVTIGSYTKDLESFVLWPGKTRPSEDDTDIPFGPNFHVHKYCSNTVEVVIRDFDRFYQNIANLHHIMVIGNYTRAIETAMAAENVRLIGPIDSSVS